MNRAMSASVHEAPRLQAVSVVESSLCNFDRSDGSAHIKEDPLWVTNDRFVMVAQCPLLPQSGQIAVSR
jgi:hypothetical protein